MILAIDTSTDTASVAICGSDSPRAELTWTSTDSRSRHLAVALRHIFLLTGTSTRDLRLVVIATGPGSFNGIRAGVSTGKGIALGCRIPLVGISTLDSIGFGASRQGVIVWAAIPAGRGEVCVARYNNDPHWSRTSEPERLPLEEAAGRCLPGELVAGPAGEKLATSAAERGIYLHALPPPWNVPRAAFLAELGRRYLDAGGRDQVDDVEPLYLRRSAAEEHRFAAMQE